MAKKFYVVWQGREKGIFNDWDTCKKQVNAFTGAKYKSFKTREEAEAAFKGDNIKSHNTNEIVSTKKKAGSPNPTTKKKRSNQTIKTYTSDEIVTMPLDTKIFTDGACEPNPGEAGSGIALYRNNAIDELWYGLYNPTGTNNTAELNALHQALIMAKSETDKNKSVAIFCDSKYSIQCVTQWAANWEKKGWKKSGSAIKNLELIKEMFALYQQLKNKVQVLHVNGHVGVEGNELADRMSIVAIKTRVTEFILYEGELNINTLLAMRVG